MSFRLFGFPTLHGDPRSPDDRSTTAQEAPRRAPGRPKRAPRRPKRRPRGPKSAPRRPQENPKTGTNNSKIELSAPRGPQEAPRGPQEARRGPKTTQEAPKRPQEALKRPPGGLKTASQKPPKAYREIPTNTQEASDPQPRHGGGTGRRPVIILLSFLLLRVLPLLLLLPFFILRSLQSIWLKQHRFRTSGDPAQPSKQASAALVTVVAESTTSGDNRYRKTRGRRMWRKPIESTSGGDVLSGSVFRRTP